MFHKDKSAFSFFYLPVKIKKIFLCADVTGRKNVVGNQFVYKNPVFFIGRLVYVGCIDFSCRNGISRKLLEIGSIHASNGIDFHH